MISCRSLRALLLSALFLGAASISTVGSADIESNLSQIKLPEGFEISVYASGIKNPRSMTLGDEGTLFVGCMEESKVYAVVDENNDYKADSVHVILDTETTPDGAILEMPIGVAFRDGSLYISAISHILRLDNIESRLTNPPEPVVVRGDYPDKVHHGWKFIAFGPDGKLYVPVGAPCNICESEDEIFGTITRMNADGSDREIIARGVRNSVGFDWHPETGEMWFTDNGGDGLGDDLPGDELNRMTQVGQHFGYPHVHQGDTLDKRYGEGHKVGDYTPPARVLGAHVASLGMRFYTGDMFPAMYKNQIFIAEHGSWNRSKKSGYRLTLVRLIAGRAVSYEPFAEGWLQGQQRWGRPADLLFLPDGSMLVSDDLANVIYRITYSD